MIPQLALSLFGIVLNIQMALWTSTNLPWLGHGCGIGDVVRAGQGS